MSHKSEALYNILPKKKDGAISSTVILPDNLIFETQNPDERVFIMLRRHLATNIGWVATSLTLVLIPVVVFVLCSILGVSFLGGISGEVFTTFGISWVYIVAGCLVWYSLVFTNSLVRFLDWYFNIYVITNERVIDFDFSPFAYHKISETALENIVDATQECIGFLPMMFNYGDVYVQTAAEKREFDFSAVSNPTWVRDKIMDLRSIVVKKPK